MKRTLWLLPAVFLSVAIVGCATKADVNKLKNDVRVWADSVRMYLDATHNAVCTLATTPPVAVLPDQQRYKCIGGGTEGTPPPKYPPQP